jgi:NADPH:quinone reductase-like Zn-dependent oxidoreductase
MTYNVRDNSDEGADTGAAAARPAIMKAITQDRYGPAEALHLAQVGLPEIAEDEVLVRVRAAGVDRGVVHLMTGLPYPVRLVGYGLRKPKNPVLGMDLSGVVTAVGSAVTEFAPGDEVFGIGRGSFAEYAPALKSKLAPKPANTTHLQAAAIAISGLTALQAVRDHAHAAPGCRILVTGASGGVGSFAVQIAKALGAEVTGVCSASKMDVVRSIGADDVIDYTSQDFTRTGEHFDAVVDTGGNRSLSDLRRILTDDGRLVIVGGENGGRWLGGADRQLRAMVLSRFVSQDLGTFISKESGKDLRVLAQMIEAGDLTAVIDTTYPLSEAADAVRHVEQGRSRGKVVITI